MDPTAARDIISTHAYMSGLQAGAMASLTATGAVLAANKYWDAFRRRLGVSGKTALIVMSGLGIFTIVSEKRLVAGARNPERYLASMDPNYVATQLRERSRLHWHHRAANYIYDHPYRTLAMVGAPLVGGIYAFQRMNTSIQASQQIMHTRIYGQGAIVLLLLSSMAFHDYMQKRGRFEEIPEDEDAREAK